MRLKGEAARGFFEVQDALTSAEGKQISGSSTFEWLLSGCRERIASLLKSFSFPVKEAKQVPQKELAGECKVPGFLGLLMAVSPVKDPASTEKAGGDNL